MPKLTDKLLTSLKLEPGQKDRLLFDAACPGLGVRLTAKGTRAFIIQWTDPATRQKVREPLGAWGSFDNRSSPRGDAGTPWSRSQGHRSASGARPSPAGRGARAGRILH